MKQTTLMLLLLLVFCNGCITDAPDNNLIGDAQTFVLCEGNYGVGNSALWSFSPDDSTTENQILGGTSLGDLAQSMTIANDKLYAVINNSHKIEIFTLGDEIIQDEVIQLNNAGPRYLAVNESIAYVSCWNLNAILILDLTNLSIIDTIAVPGMPENLILNDNSLFASIPMNADWSPASNVLEISTITNEIIQTYEVISGPSDLRLIGENLFVASTFYGANWTTYTGLSKIDLSTGIVTSNTDGNNSTILGDIILLDAQYLFRSTSTGLAPVNEDLSLNLDNIIGSQTRVYSVGADEEYLFFGTTDYTAPDTVYVTTHSGESVNKFIVGAIPGDFVSILN